MSPSTIPHYHFIKPVDQDLVTYALSGSRASVPSQLGLSSSMTASRVQACYMRFVPMGMAPFVLPLIYWTVLLHNLYRLQHTSPGGQHSEKTLLPACSCSPCWHMRTACKKGWYFLFVQLHGGQTGTSLRHLPGCLVVKRSGGLQRMFCWGPFGNIGRHIIRQSYREPPA